MTPIWKHLAAAVLASTAAWACATPEDGPPGGPPEEAAAARSEALTSNDADPIVISADDSYTVYVAGAPVGSGSYYPTAQTHKARVAGSVIAVGVTRDWFSDTRPAAVILDAYGFGRGGDDTEPVISTDRLWRCTNAAPPGWQAQDFDDSAWPLAVEYGPNGAPPWGHVPGLSAQARWIGTSDVEAPYLYCRGTVLGCAADEARGRPASANNTNPAYPPSLAFDHDLTTAWRSAGSTGSYVQVDLGQPRVIGRAVATWGVVGGVGNFTATSQLEGSLDGVTWAPLGPPMTRTPSTNGTQTATPVYPRVAARYVRLRATNWAGLTGFVDDIQVFYPCTGCESNWAYRRPAAASGYIDSGFEPEYAFDDSDTTGWVPDVTNGAYLLVDLGGPRGLTSARLKWGVEALQPGRTAESVLQCSLTYDPSNPDAGFATIETVAPITHTAATSGNPQLVQFKTQPTCRYVRLRAKDWAGGFPFVNDFQLYRPCATCTTNLAQGRPVAGTCPATPPGLAVDGDFNTAWQSACSTGSWVSVNVGDLPKVGYALVKWGLEAGCAETDAESVLEGSTDGTNFTPLFTFNQVTREDFFKQEAYFPPRNLRFVRLRATDWSNASGFGCRGGVAELQLCDF